MENYSHPDIPDILQIEGNSECVDCGEKKPKWASMNNGVFLCLKCAGVHRSFGMNISFIRSLQIDSWTENQLLFLTKGGNNNFKKNLNEFNIDISSASLDIKYKSKAADYYRRYLKNEVDRECDSNYVPTKIVKPELNIAQEILEIKEENKEEIQEKKEEKTTKSFFGFMSNVLSKVKDGTVEASKKVGKGFTDLKLGEKFKTAGTAIAGAAKTSGNFIVDTTQKAVNSEFVQNISKKTKEGVNTMVTRTKSLINKENKPENEENRTEISVKRDENENNKEEKKESENKEEKKENNENKEENKEESKENEEKKEAENNNVPEEKADTVPEENLETGPEGENQNS